MLPITGRGVELTDRFCWALLGLAMVAAAALILYLNRGTTFFLDELVHYYASPSFDLKYVFEPVNGHLGITAKLVYKAVLETAGADYVVFRVLHVLSELVAAGLFFALVKRRVGALPALAPTIVLLFLGSAYAHVVIPVGMSIFVCVAASLGALLALERGDRRGEVAACLLLVFAIATFTIGLAFLVGVAISVLLREDRWRRAWIFGVPLVLYAAWWMWSQSQPGSSGEETALSNAFEIPLWIADSLSAVTASVAGIDYDFAGGEVFGGLGWGRVLAAVAFAALLLRLRRGNVPATLWVALGIVISYWCLGGLAGETGERSPASLRYMYPGAVMVLLVAAEAARGVRFSRAGLLALYAIAALAVAGNVSKLADGAADFRGYSDETRAEFAAVELARGEVPDNFNPESVAPNAATVGARAGPYFESADRYGSLGYTPAELGDAGPRAHYVTDQILPWAYGLQLLPDAERPTGRCETFERPAPGEPIVVELPRGGAAMRARSADIARVGIGRFDGARSVVGLGSLNPGEWSSVRIPEDASEVPWTAVVAEARSVRVCRPS